MIDNRKNQQGEAQDQGQKGGQSSRSQDQGMEKTNDHSTEDTDQSKGGEL